MPMIFVDCEGVNVVQHRLKEFGAVEYKTRSTFHGKYDNFATFEAFKKWLVQFPGRPVFVSDNPAYDWQMINYFFLYYFGENPFGHSARRIGDFYAGLVGDWRETQKWKRFRRTRHDHSPVNDAMGNVEAFERILRGEK